MKIIYIAGEGRSGSTLVDSLLGNSDNSISIGESYRFWKRYYNADTYCGCGDKIFECILWKNVDKELQNKIKNYNPEKIWNQIQFLLCFNNVKKISYYINEPEWEDLKRTIILFYMSIKDLSKKEIIIDSSKSLGWLNILLSINLFDIKIIHLERELYLVANSWKKDILLPEYYNKEVRMPKKSNYVIIKEWFKITLLTYKLKNRKDYYYLNYRNLVINSDKVLSEVEKFTGLKLIKPFKLKYNHSIGGNPMRSNSSKLIKINNSKEKLDLNILELLIFKILSKIKKIIL